jgi:hypothetical protein
MLARTHNNLKFNPIALSLHRQRLSYKKRDSSLHSFVHELSLLTPANHESLSLLSWVMQPIPDYSFSLWNPKHFHIFQSTEKFVRRLDKSISLLYLYLLTFYQSLSWWGGVREQRFGVINQIRHKLGKGTRRRRRWWWDDDESITIIKSSQQSKSESAWLAFCGDGGLVWLGLFFFCYYYYDYTLPRSSHLYKSTE